MSPEKTRQFSHLSAPNESLRPLTPADIDLPAMRNQLIEAGVNLALTETERKSLAEPQFKRLSTGRGPGMVAALGKEKTWAMFEWCRQRSEDEPRLKEGNVIAENSQGRGLRQLATDIIQLVANPQPSDQDLDRFCLRLNQRVREGLLWKYRRDKPAKDLIRQQFSSVPKPESSLSSVPSGSVSDLWEFLTRPNQK